MSLAGSIVLVVMAPGVDRRAADLLMAVGATVREVPVADLAPELDSGVDALVLDVGTSPELFAAFASAFHASSRRLTPAVALVDAGLPAFRCALLGPVSMVELSSDDGQLALRIDEALSRARHSDVGFHMERAEVLGKRLGAMVRDAQTAAHDAGALCGVALGYAANMRDGFAGDLTPPQATHVAQILSAIQGLATLLERFSGTARAQADVPDAPPPSVRRLARRRHRFDLAALVQKTAGLFESLAADRSIRFSIEAAGPRYIWGDPTQLKQLVTNLVVNAIKFTPERGAVAVLVDVATGEGPGVQGRRCARIVVNDSGPGIEEAEREKVFERGYRIAAHSHVPGTGVGLAVCRDVVQLHGGNVVVRDSELGGASFVVTLPLDLRRRREQGVLFVDDAAAALRLVAALEVWGVEEVEADGAKLVELIGDCRTVVAIPRTGFRVTETALREAADDASGPTSRGGGR